MFYDGVGIHEYLLCTVLAVVVTASDPKDLFEERVTMFTTQSRADMGRLS
jgi:hypothetical protein